MVTSTKCKSFSGLFIFKIQGKEFCMDLREILTVLNPQECNIRLDVAESGLEYAGDSYKIIPFDVIYKLSCRKSPATRIILIKKKKTLVGFWVDEIIEIMAIDEKSSKISQLEHSNNPHIKLILRYGEREMIVPDLEKIITCIK
jgi:hypothetical protein